MLNKLKEWGEASTPVGPSASDRIDWHRAGLCAYGQRISALCRARSIRQSAVNSGALPASQVNASVTRILKAKSQNVCG